jgi:hypothetical protein
MDSQNTYDEHNPHKSPCDFILKLYDMMSVHKLFKYRLESRETPFSGVTMELKYA